MNKNNESKENTLAAIELVIKEFLSDDVIGRWVSVKERSLGNIMKQVGLDSHYSVAIYEELKTIGLIEKEGERFHLRYKIVTNVIPDIQATAERIYNRNLESMRQSKEACQSRKGDCVPLRRRSVGFEEFERRETKKSNKSGKVVQDLSRIPHLGQVVYALVDGYITEAKITCVRFDENDKVKVNFTTPIIRHTDDDETEFVKKENYCLRNISFSVEDLVKKLTADICKFDNKHK